MRYFLLCFVLFFFHSSYAMYYVDEWIWHAQLQWKLKILETWSNENKLTEEELWKQLKLSSEQIFLIKFLCAKKLKHSSQKGKTYFLKKIIAFSGGNDINEATKIYKEIFKQQEGYDWRGNDRVLWNTHSNLAQNW